MQRLLCTIGFTGKTAEEFFTLLSNAGVQQVIDIRQNRSGQLSGFSKHPDLSFFLKKIAGIEYLHEPLLAPAPELLKTYRRTKDWTSYETELLAAFWREQGDAVEIRHLVSPRRKPVKPRRKSVGNAS